MFCQSFFGGCARLWKALTAFQPIDVPPRSVMIAACHLLLPFRRAQGIIGTLDKAGWIPMHLYNCSCHWLWVTKHGEVWCFHSLRLLLKIVWSPETTVLWQPIKSGPCLHPVWHDFKHEHMPHSARLHYRKMVDLVHQGHAPGKTIHPEKGVFKYCNRSRDKELWHTPVRLL